MKRGKEPSSGGGSKPGGRGRPGSGARVPPALQQKVDELVRDTGIPQPWAWQVARGQATLNDVITRLARTDRVAQLVARHGLDKSLATQVANGELELDTVLRKRRMVEHLALHRDRSTLDQAHADGRSLTLYLHGLRKLTARIRAVEAYELELEGPEGVERLHKLQVKLAHDPDARVRIGQVGTGRAAAEPIRRPQDRLACSDRRIFTALDDAKECRITTLEGDVATGRVAWVSRWELGLQQRGGVELVVFRHALQTFEEI